MSNLVNIALSEIPKKKGRKKEEKKFQISSNIFRPFDALVSKYIKPEERNYQ